MKTEPPVVASVYVLNYLYSLICEKGRAMKNYLGLLFFVCLFLIKIPLLKAEEPAIPAALKDWVAWVKDSHPEWECARTNNNYECIWPGEAFYTISQNEGRFEVNVEILKESWLPLPSSANHQPAKLLIRTLSGGTIDAPIDHREDGLFIKLPKGSFNISGSFFWNSPPNELPLPDLYGMLNVATGENTALKFRRKESQLWIESPNQTSTVNSLSLSVTRLIKDDLPLEITTLIRLKVAGGARSINLGKVLPLNSVPVKVESPLINHLSSEGDLAVQVTPGEYDIVITSILPQPVTTITLASNPNKLWPKDEIWSIETNSSFRIIEVSGGKSIPADLSDLPDQWRNGTILAIPSEGTSISLKEIARGEQNALPNTITINREIWLDMSGEGYTAVDQISGTASRDFRLNALAETELGRVDVDDKQRLVTIDPATQAKGVELRNSLINVKAVSRIAEKRSFSAVGWNFDANNISLKINLPPSWKLFHVSGALDSNNSWTSSWDLMQIFIAILIILSTFKIFGKKAALIVAAVTILNQNEFLAPKTMFIHVLILSALCFLVSDKTTYWGKMFNRLLIITTGIWLFEVLTFEKLQFTQFLYPQLEAGTRYRTAIQEILLIINSSIFNWPIIAAMIFGILVLLHAISKMKGFLGGFLKLCVLGFAGIMLLSFVIVPTMFFSQSYRSGNSASSYNSSFNDEIGRTSKLAPQVSREGTATDLSEVAIQEDEQAYSAKSLQSGPAVPSWKWRTYYVYFSAPISPEHKISLILLSPQLNKILTLVRIFLLGVLVLIILKSLGFAKLLENLKKRGTFIATLLLALSLFSPVQATAEVPSAEILKQLEDKIANTLCTRAECAQITTAEINIVKDRFQLKLEVSSEGKSAVVVPGPLTALIPSSIKINGSAKFAANRRSDDFLVVRTENGKNLVEIEGEVGSDNAFSVTFLSNPLFIKVLAPEYLIEGLLPSGTAPDGLRFTKLDVSENKTDQKKQSEKTNLPYWVLANREFNLGSRIVVKTTVERIGDLEKSFETQVPLLPAEQVISGSIRIEQNKAIVQFPAQVMEVSFQSILPFAENLTITASNSPRFNETWSVICNDHTRCTTSGIAAISHELNGQQNFLWNPFPGEEIKIKLETLNAAEGEHLTIDNLTHNVRYGLSKLSGDIQIVLRATEQTTFKLKLENGITVEAVLLDEKQISTEAIENGVSIILSPGNHIVNLRYANNSLLGLFSKIPAITLNNQAHNISVLVTPSLDRWILWTGGSTWGPCVVFWSKMLLLCALCLLLRHFHLLKLSKFGAIFLGIGLSSVSILMMSIPLAWIIFLNIWPQLRLKLLNINRGVKLIFIISLSILAIAVFYLIVKNGLLFDPPMLITGNGSSAHYFKWFFDYSEAALPQPYIVSFPLWYWRVFSLIWSTWLVLQLLSWLKNCVEIVRVEAEKKD